MEHNQSALVSYASSLCELARLSKNKMKTFKGVDYRFFLNNRANDFPVLCRMIKMHKRKCRKDTKTRLAHLKRKSFLNGPKSQLFTNIRAVTYCLKNVCMITKYEII